jgi:phage shock protein A
MFDFLFPSRKKIADLERQVNALQSELVQARMKNASYRGKIGSLSRKLKEANA